MNDGFWAGFWSEPSIRMVAIPIVLGVFGTGFGLLAKRNGDVIGRSDFWAVGIGLCMIAFGINTAFFAETVTSTEAILTSAEAIRENAPDALPDAFLAELSTRAREGTDRFVGLVVSLLVVMVTLGVYQRFMPVSRPSVVTGVVIIPSVFVGALANGLVFLTWS